MYASLFGISGALHLAGFEQPAKQLLLSILLVISGRVERKEGGMCFPHFSSLLGVRP